MPIIRKWKCHGYFAILFYLFLTLAIMALDLNMWKSGP